MRQFQNASTALARCRRVTACYTPIMYTTFCDSCEQKIPDDDRAAVHLRLRYQQFELCGRCSGAVIEMLKDMRLIKELDIIR
jgi:hypothetical protein